MKKKPLSHPSLIDKLKHNFKIVILKSKGLYYKARLKKLDLRIFVLKYIIDTVTKNPKFYEYYLTIKAIIFTSVMLIATFGTTFFVFNRVTIKNQLLLDLISSFNWKIFSINYTYLLFGLLFLFAVFMLLSRLMKLEPLLFYNLLNFSTLAISLSMSFSFFISLDTKDGDIVQIIISILLGIFPTKLMKKIFNNTSENSLDDVKEKLSNDIDELKEKELKEK